MKSAKKKPTLLIDADTLIYASSSGNEVPIQWSEWLWTLHANFDECVAQLEDMLVSIQNGIPSSDIIMVLSHEKRWRNAVMPEYKGNRKNVRKPVVYQPMREYVQDRWQTYMKPGLEGDDVLGILTTHPNLIPGKKVIVSIDKDMKTLPGFLCNYMKDRNEDGDPWTIHEVTELDADYQHMFQTLTGDTTDGYKGCPGVGPVKAETILKNCPQEKWWDAVVASYVKAGLNEEVALMNAQVARICRYTDYDFEKKEVILWTPTHH